MSEKLNRLGEERDKALKKRDLWDARYKEMCEKYKEQENTEIHDMVHAANLTPDQLAVLLRNAKNNLPDPAILEAVQQDQQERTSISEEVDQNENCEYQ